MTTIAEFSRTLDEYKSIVAVKSQELREKDAKIERQDFELQILKEKIRLLQHRHFGKSSEKLTSEFQELFPSLETVAASINMPEETINVPSHTKKKPGRRPLPDDLPREEVIIDLSESEKICKIHGIAMSVMGDERSESIEHVPESYKVLVTIRPKYRCDCCEDPEIKIASVPEKIIPKSIATPSLLSHIVLSKFTDHLPLYRQESIFERSGITLSRSTMAEWMIRVGNALTPITNLMQDKLLEGEYISCDETKLRVLTDDDKPIKNLHYLWIRSRPKEFGKPIYLFEYADSRRTKVAKEILDGFEGYLQVDQYIGYDFTEKIPHIIRVGCLAHVRRKFFEAQKAQKEKQSVSGKALALISTIYKKEAEIQGIQPDQRTVERKKKLQPLFENLKSHLDENRRKIPNQSATGKAITYAINAWESIMHILDDHRIRLDNNLTENAIRPVALGRKNYLFCYTSDGAEAAARIYSILATAKANGLELRPYLIKLLTDLPKAKSLEDFEALLPLV